MRLRELLWVQEGTFSPRQDPIGAPPGSQTPENEDEFEDLDDFEDLDELDDFDEFEDDTDSVSPPAVVAPAPAPRDLPTPGPVIERLRAGGIVSPKVCVAEAERARLPLHFAAALLEKESGGGHNVFGHDRDRSGKYIFPARDGTVKVTKELYQEYKRRRIASGNKVMQGVGPCQLTWFSFQDEADKQGGCWKPQINMRVGFRRLASLMREHGDSVGARMYNGSGDAAVAYSADLLKKAAAWKVRLEGRAQVPPATKDLEAVTVALAELQGTLDAIVEAQPAEPPERPPTS